MRIVMNCQDECLVSAKEITKKRKENWFTFEEIQENFKKRGVESKGGEYVENSIKAALSNSRYDYNDIFGIYEGGKKRYKINLIFLDEKDFREEINKRLKKLEDSIKP